MLGNAFLDIAIGLVMMFLVLSLVSHHHQRIHRHFHEIAGEVSQAGARAHSRRAQCLQGLLRQWPDQEHAAEAGPASSYPSGSTFALAILQSLGDPAKPIRQIDDVKTAIDKLEDSDLKKMLIAQITAGQDSIDKLRGEIATWFDGAMDRVTGIYQRRIKLISLLVGLVVAIGLNVDSITVARALWNDDALRGQMAQPGAGLYRPGRTPACAGSAAARRRAFGGQPETQGRAGGTASPVHRLGQEVEGFAWHDWVSKVAGWLFTAAALSLGAPFWFDPSSKFMNVRGGGGKPEREEDRKAKP